MPVFQYFVGVGSVLLALLLLADHWLPKPVEAVSSRDMHPAIRIATAQKWPERVVFDTRAIFPPRVPAALAAASPPPAVANIAADASPVAGSPLLARAELLPAVAKKRMARKKAIHASIHRAMSRRIGGQWLWHPLRQPQSWPRRFASYSPW